MTHRSTFAITVFLASALVSIGCTVTGRDSPDTGGGGGVDSGPGNDSGPTPGRDAGPHVQRDVITTDAPADAPDHFTGTPDPANAPSLVYPDDGVMIPPNLERFELHFMPNGSDLFRLDLTAGVVDFRVYFDCQEPVGGGCVFTPDHDTWAILSDAAHGIGPLTYTLTGTDSAGRIGTSEPRTIQFAQEDITGGVYYWNAAAGSIMRYEFGVPGAVEETYLRGNTINCIGCHAVSRDGTRIAVGRGIPTQNVQVYDVATRAMVYQNFRDTSGTALPWRPNFFSFNPDSTQIVGSNPHGLRIADAAGTMILQDITTGPSSMPDWAPDGTHIAYVQGGATIEAPSLTSGSIATIRFDGSSWVADQMLAPGNGGNNVHPTYSPDSAWVLYNRSPGNMDSMATCISDSQLWAVAADGSGTPFQLENVGGTCTSWPKFDPTTYHDHGHDLFWIAWATGRGYGLRYADGSIMQIWMAAFDPTLAAAGMQPTHPAFRLPFQNIATGNHIAQWVTSIERMGCTTNADCGGEFCVEGRCYEQAPVF